MAPDIDRILSDFIDAWNAGARPDVDDYLAQVSDDERDDLAGELTSFLALAPAPAVDDRRLAEIRSKPAVAAALAARQQTAGLLPALLKVRRERLGLSTAKLAETVAADLGLSKAQTPKTAGYLERWERGELVASRVSRKVFDALATALRISRDELERAAERTGRVPVAPVFRAAAPAAAPAPAAEMAKRAPKAPYLDVLADGLQTPGRAQRDEVDELFLGGR